MGSSPPASAGRWHVQWTAAPVELDEATSGFAPALNPSARMASKRAYGAKSADAQQSRSTGKERASH
jgi:hypothetical protein